MVDRYGTSEGGVDQDGPKVEFQNGSTYDESVIMVFQLGESTVCGIGRHECADRPLIDRAGGSIWLEEGRGDKRLQHKPSAKIDTIIDGRRAETIPRT